MNKPTTTDTHGAVITLDGLPIGQSHNPEEFLLKFQGQSVDYALTHGGYGIERRPDQVRGYMAYMLIKGRRGYGVDGWIVRSIENFQALSLQNDPDLTQDGYFTDEIAAPTLSAIRAALNMTTGHMDNIRGALDTWIMTVAARFGLDGDDI